MARARTRIARGTSDGVSARDAGAPRAEAMPVPKASRKKGQVFVAPARVTASRPSITATSRPVAIASRVRRGNRSARWPAGSARSGNGMNIASPTSPRSSGLLRTAYTCQPIATNDISIANPVASMTPRKRTKSRCWSGESADFSSAGYAASPSSPGLVSRGRNSTSRRWILEPSTSSTQSRRPSTRTSSPGSAARPIRSKTKPATVW